MPLKKKKGYDISDKKLVSVRDGKSALAAGASRVLISENCVATPSARDFLAQHNIADEIKIILRLSRPNPILNEIKHPANAQKTAPVI